MLAHLSCTSKRKLRVAIVNEVKTFDRVLSFTAESPIGIQEEVNDWIREQEKKGKTIKIISTSLGVIKGYDDDEGDWLSFTALIGFSITSAPPPPQQSNPESSGRQTNSPTKKGAALFLQNEERSQDIDRLP